MSQAATPGIPGGGGQNLRAALASQAPPSNPRTPADRVDPHEETLLDQQRIRRALEVAKQHRPDENDPLYQIYGTMHAAITRLRDGTPQEDVTDAMALALFAMVSPRTKQQLLQMISAPNAPGGMPMGGPPPGGPPAGPGQPAVPPGAPIGPGMPVSSGAPPQ